MGWDLKYLIFEKPIHEIALVLHENILYYTGLKCPVVFSIFLGLGLPKTALDEVHKNIRCAVRWNLWLTRKRSASGQMLHSASM